MPPQTQTALEKFANSGHTVSTENLTQFTKTFQTMSGVGMLQARYENMARIKFLRNRLTKRIQDCYVSSIEDENNIFELLALSFNMVIYQFYFATSQCDSIIAAIRRRCEQGQLQKKCDYCCGGDDLLTQIRNQSLTQSM